MKRLPRFAPEVEDDLVSGYTWYETKRKGLGDEFLSMFYSAASEIPRNPLLYPKISNNFRRRLLKRFPYAIYYRVEHDEVIIFGFFHCARHPGDIGKKLLDRKIK